MCMQTFFTIFHSVQEIGPLSLFQKLDFGITSTNDKCHFAIPWARSCQYQCVCKILSKYKCIPVMGNFRKPSTDGHTHSHKLTGDKHKTVHGQITKTSSPKGNDRSPESNVPRSNLVSKKHINGPWKPEARN